MREGGREGEGALGPGARWCGGSVGGSVGGSLARSRAGPRCFNDTQCFSDASFSDAILAAALIVHNLNPNLNLDLNRTRNHLPRHALPPGCTLRRPAPRPQTPASPPRAPPVDPLALCADMRAP